MTKRSRMAFGIAVILVCIQLWTPVYGSDTDDLQQSIDELEETQEQVEELQAQKEALEESMQALDEQLGTAVKELADITTAQEAKQQEIDAASADLAAAEETESRQYEQMKRRIRYMYEEGSQSYLAVLLSAADASELLSRAEYITDIYQYDRDMLARYEEAKTAVEEQKSALSTQYAELETLKTQATEKKTSVETLMEQKNAELAQYTATITSTQALADQYRQQLDDSEALIAQLEAAASEAAAQQDAAIAALADSLAQLENEARDAAEAQAAQAILAKMAEEAQAELAAAGESALTVDPNTLFVWPCPSSTRITSEYGYRVHPIYGDVRLHNGIDIGADLGESIIAAYKGTVIGAGYDSSMGNYVMIDHGEGLVTIYMHASYLCVSAGDTVETGQLIALVGATGDATGSHLHFTVRLNGTYVSPWNYVSY